MSNVKVDYSQLRRLRRDMEKAGKSYKAGTNRLLKKLGVVVQGLARELAPESPTLGQYARMNKSGVTNRNRSSITTGSLRDSITSKVGKDEVSIFVPVNSRGGKYAKKIHDEKGKTWHELGPRSKQKGATDEFIYKAEVKSRGEQGRLVDQVVNEFIRGLV